MRKMISLLLVVITVLLLAASCGKGSENGGKSGNGGNGGNGAKKNTVIIEPTDSDIGIWYAVWYGYEKPGDTHELKNDLWLQWDIQYKPLLPDGTYGYYDSKDPEIIRYNLEQMTEAGIDFIIMDQTNHIDVENGFINNRAIATAKAISEWNKEGKKPIYYCSAVGAIQWEFDGATIESEARTLYSRYLSQKYSDAHYMMDGKPLLIVYGDGGEGLWKKYKENGGNTKYTDMFTLRFADNQSTPGYYGWAFDQGTQEDDEVMVVMPGWDNRKGATPVPRDHGEWYRKSWETVLFAEVKPKIVVINSFNEYAENTGVFTAKTDLYGKDAPDLYWNMTKEYINLYLNGGEYEISQ